MIYTRLTPEDVVALLDFGPVIQKETRYGSYEFNRKSAMELLELIYEHPEIFFIAFTKNGEGQITGLLMGQVSTEYFSGVKYICDLGMFVHPAYRGSSIFVRLLKAFEDWGVLQGAKKIILYHSTEIEQEKTKRLFKKLAYKEFGSIFDKEL